ncbi:MAG: hypothetical protein JNK60_21065, partial [Acidobacteria bacterium]|nr:hypothetical protein [Acidobacteriota bacterium]
MRSYRPADGLPQAQVTAIAQDPSGFLWVGTQAGGVARYDGRRWETFDAESGLSGSSVYGLAVDSKGLVYAASNGGAARYTGHAWELLPLPKDPGHALVTAIALGAKDEVYLGTYAGLVVLEAAGGSTETLVSDASL